MKARDAFSRLRRRSQKFNLRIRLSLLVTAEMLLAVILAFVLDISLSKYFLDGSDLPLFLEIVGMAIIVGIFVTHAVSRYFFNPIKKLGNAMEQIADGDFNVRIEQKTSVKEIAEVYTGFNMMASELAGTEILQTNFVSSVSHEIKTPISAIEGYATLLSGCGNLDEEQMEYTQKILYNTKRLSSLTGSILLLAKLENQTIPTSCKTFSLDEQIRQAIVGLEEMWSAKNIDFDIDLPAVDYYGNESLMYHVWHNIIGNAIKFSPENSPVTIKMLVNAEGIIITFEDKGEGISEECIKHIFDKFYQADSSHKTEGNGLGLPLVKQILTLEGGEIFAANREGGGAIFTVKLKSTHKTEN